MPLAAARTLAWALWLGGWLVIGSLGHQQAPSFTAALAPLALWLLLIGALLAWSPRLAPRGLTLATLAAAGSVGVALLTTNLWLLVAGWALLVVTASRTVKALRRSRPSDPPPGSPLAPAAAGALLAWALAGDFAPAPLALWWAWVAVALALVALQPRRAGAARGCRAGLFDCALPGSRFSGPGAASDLAHQAALLAMLPMMAALPALADWCGADAWPQRSATALHLGAMLLPPLLLPLLRPPAAMLRLVLALLMVAGGAALLLRQGVQGLMAAALLHGVAWGLAWGGPLAHRATASTRAAGHHLAGATPGRAAAAAAALLLALGLGLDAAGPDALRLAHGALALLGAAALLAQGRAATRCTSPAKG